VAEKNKKNRWEKNSFWVGEKKTLLKALVAVLALAAFTSVFFCGRTFIQLLI